jgi:hypothetical protein
MLMIGGVAVRLESLPLGAALSRFLSRPLCGGGHAAAATGNGGAGSISGAASDRRGRHHRRHAMFRWDKALKPRPRLAVVGVGHLAGSGRDGGDTGGGH